MPLVSSTIPNLVGGVSQQPPAMRLPTSCEEMENAWPSIVSGLMKRPPSVHLSKINGYNPSTKAASYLIDRGANYKYLVLISDNDINVVDLNTGSRQLVSKPDGVAYLNSTSPVDHFRFVTIGDATFIVNKRIAVGGYNAGEFGGRRNPDGDATVHVTQSAANTYYSIYIDGILRAEYLTGVGVDVATAVAPTSAIASELVADLNASGFSSFQSGSTINIQGLAPWTRVTVQAGSGDRSLRAFRQSIQQFADLPPQVVEGRIVKVEADAESGADDYWVQYSNGIWQECVAFNSRAAFNPATMPWILVRNGDGTWTFSQHEWDMRLAGNDEANGWPTFAGRPINDIFVWNGRLGFLSDENVILSEVDNYENFWRTTTATALDSDRIDVAVLHKDVDILQHAVLYNRDLLVMSNKNQFRVTFTNYLSAKTLQILYSTSFNMSERLSPINMGNSLYFVDDREDYKHTKVYEYFPKESTFADEGEDVTAPVPEYIPNNILWFAGSNRAKALVVNAESEPNTIYMYKFFWAGDKKVQTAWSRWTIPDAIKIHHGVFSGTFLYLIVQRAGGFYIESIDFDEDVFDSSTNYGVMLDRRYAVPPGNRQYNAATDETTIFLPYSYSLDVKPNVVARLSTNAGARIPVASYSNPSAGQLKIMGNYSGAQYTVYVGLPYMFMYEFTTPMVRQTKGSGDVAVLDGRVQLKYISLEYHDSGPFETEVVYDGRSVVSRQYFDGKIVGSSEGGIGSQGFSTGTFRIPVMSRNDTCRIRLYSDAPFPIAFGSAEWQAMYAPKSQQRL